MRLVDFFYVVSIILLFGISIANFSRINAIHRINKMQTELIRLQTDTMQDVIAVMKMKVLGPPKKQRKRRRK